MKTAICLSGQPRGNIKKSVTTIYENIIDPNSCDVFVCSNIASKGSEDPWIELVTVFHELGIQPKVLELREDFFIDKEDHPIFEYFPQKAKKIVKAKKSEEPIQCTRAQGVLQILFYVERCNRHKIQWEQVNKFKYDWVVKCRLGLGFLEKLDLTTLDRDFVYIKKKAGPSLYVDCFACGSSENMNAYSNRLSELLDNKKVPPEVNSTENHLKYVLEKYNVPVSNENVPDFINVEEL